MNFWDELWIATALLLVIEGIIPFLSPTLMRRALATISGMDDHSLRLSGLVSMVIGVVVLYLVH